MVLQSDFDKPTRVDCGKSYELSIQFEIDTKTKHLLQDNLPGFLQYSLEESANIATALRETRRAETSRKWGKWASASKNF